MNVFMIADILDMKLVKGLVQQHYDGGNYITKRGTIFVASQGETAQKVAEKVGLSKASSQHTSGIVVRISDYWGHNDRQIWKWIEIMEGAGG